LIQETSAVPNAKPLSFHRYIFTRRHHQWRGSRAGWSFVAHALGDPDLPDAASWGELRDHLINSGAEQDMIKAANMVWRSYLSQVSKARRGDDTNAFGQLRAIASGVSAASSAGPRGQPCAATLD
jgi:hypothetical protein